MAFWKKSDDPWDRKPEKQQTIWRENDAPAEPAPPSEPDRLTPKEERIRNIIEGPKAAPVVPEKCPWCGQDMKRVYIFSKSFTKWSYEMPGGWLQDYEILEDVGGLFDPVYKQGSYCESCEKMTLNVKKPRPPHKDPNTFEDYARQWKEMEAREREEKRKKKGD